MSMLTAQEEELLDVALLAEAAGVMADMRTWVGVASAATEYAEGVAGSAAGSAPVSMVSPERVVRLGVPLATEQSPLVELEDSISWSEVSISGGFANSHPLSPPPSSWEVEAT